MSVAHGSADNPDAERRQVPRLADGPPLTVIGTPAAVHDVSRAGICLLWPEAPKPGQRTQLQLRDEVSQSACEMQAMVIWHREGRVGLCWVDMQPWQDVWLLQRFELWLGREDD